MLSIIICGSQQTVSQISLDQNLNNNVTVTNSTSNIIRNIYYDIECFNSIWYDVLLGIVIILSILLVITALGLSVIYNDPRPGKYSHLPWGCSQSKAELIKTIIKIIMAVTVLLRYYATWIIIIGRVAVMILSLFLFAQRYKYFFFAKREIYIAIILQEGLFLYLNIIVSIISFIKHEFSIFLFTFILISAILWVFFIVFYFLRRISNFSLSSYVNLRSENDIEQFYLTLYNNLCENDGKGIDLVPLYGLIQTHRKSNACSNKYECVCLKLLYFLSHNKLESYLQNYNDDHLLESESTQNTQSENNENFPSQGQTDLILLANKEQHISSTIKKEDLKKKKEAQSRIHQLLFKFLYSILQDSLNAHPKSIRIQFILQELLRQELNNEFKSYFLILKLMNQKPSVDQEFFLYQSRQQVERTMYKKYQQLLINKSSIDVVKVYEFEKLVLEFEKEVISTSNNCLSFWRELLDNKRLDVNKIHDFGVQISNSYSQVSLITKKMIRLFPNHILMLKIYSFFLSDVMNNDSEAANINLKIKTFYENSRNVEKNSQDEDKFFGYNTRTAIITITVTPINIGTIVNANFECKSLLQYSNREIKGKNVRMLMPKLLSDNHDSFIKNYFDTAKANVLEIQRIVFAKNKEGYAVPVNILVKAIPNLKRSLIFVGFLKKVEDVQPYLIPPTQYVGQDYHIILADTDGYIHGFTKNCWETFGFKPSFFFNKFGDPEQSIKIEKIIKQLQEPLFVGKCEHKKEGAFCSLDTGQVLANVSKELLSKEEQEVLINISGSYNINLQIESQTFSHGKIKWYIYKILKLSRIIRSQNVFDLIQIKVGEINETSEASEELDPAADIFQSSHIHGGNNFAKNVDSITLDFEESDSESNDSSKERSMSTINVNDNNSESAYVQTFKKTISNNEMPSSIKKLNKLVYLLISLIFVVSIFDLIQQLTYYKFNQLHLVNFQSLFLKQALFSQLGINTINLGLITQGFQSNSYQEFNQLNNLLRDFMDQDMGQIKQIQETIEALDQNNLIYKLKDFESNPEMTLNEVNKDGQLTNQTQSLSLTVSQYVSKVQDLLYSTSQDQFKISSLLFNNYTKITNIEQSNSQKNTYFIIENSLYDFDRVTHDQQKLFKEALIKQSNLNHIIQYVAYSFFVIFILISGIIVFPIVIGVQKNKVMILSIYFELPHIEIQKLFYKCLHFLIKIDKKFDNGMTVEQNQQARKMLDDMAIMFEEQMGFPYDDIVPNADQSLPEITVNQDSEKQQFSNGLAGSRQVSPRDDTSNRDLFFQKIIQNDEMNNKTPSLPMSLSEHTKNKHKIDIEKQIQRMKDRKSMFFPARQGSLQNHRHNKGNESSQNLKRNSSMIQDNDEELDLDEGEIDKEKMFKQIRVKNNRINTVTLSVILCFLAYFSFSFGINHIYVDDLRNAINDVNEIYSLHPTYLNTFFVFMYDVINNKTMIEQDSKFGDRTLFQSRMANTLSLIKEKELIFKKQNGNIFNKKFIDEMLTFDNSSFCDSISEQLPSNDLYKNQCGLIDQGQLQYGQKKLVFDSLYALQNLEFRFDEQNKNGTILRQILNDSLILSFTVKSNLYLRASLSKINQDFDDAFTGFFKKALLINKLKFAFFILFTFVIVAILWRIFLKNIQAEVYRSKGMLNMIPTEYLERDNNIQKLSLNKLINMN